MKVDPTRTRLIYWTIFPKDGLSEFKFEIEMKLSNAMDKNQEIKQIKQFPNLKHQTGTFSSNDCFKTDNRSFTTLFQGEVKYLNLTKKTVSQGLLIRLGSLSMQLSNQWFLNRCDFLRTPYNEVKS